MKFVISLVAALATACAVRAAELPLVLDAASSRVEIAVKATVDSFVGKLEAYDAAIVVDTARGEVVRARFAFHFNDVKTGKADRDAAMHEWQDTATHPDGDFTLVAIEADPAGSGLRARGSLVLHGLAKEIVFPISIVRTGDQYVIEGDAALDTREFGLPIIRKFMVLKVDPEVHVRFHLQGGTAPASATAGSKK